MIKNLSIIIVALFGLASSIFFYKKGFEDGMTVQYGYDAPTRAFMNLNAIQQLNMNNNDIVEEYLNLRVRTDLEAYIETKEYKPLFEFEEYQEFKTIGFEYEERIINKYGNMLENFEESTIATIRTLKSP